MLSPGTTLSGRYLLNKRIGTGGVGEVWSSTDVLLQRQVAVKVLLPALVSDSEFITRFRTEARLMAALRHPGIVQVYDYGEHAPVDDGQLDYLVMEFIEGAALSKRIAATGKLSVAETLSILAQAADALHVAHEAGIVHRDVKPSNLVIRPDGSIILIDFGVARSAGVTSVTSSSVIVGSPQYMAPEQAMGQPISPATDVYALGAVAYCCLTGRPPFIGDNPIQVIGQLLHGAPEKLSGEIPPVVAELVRRALDKDPGKRHPSAAAFAEAVRAAQGAAAGLAVAAPPMTPGVPQLSPAELPSATGVGPSWAAVPPLPLGPAAPVRPAVPEPKPAASPGTGADWRLRIPGADPGNRRRTAVFASVAATVVLGLVALIAVLVLRPEADPPEAQAATNQTIDPASGGGVGLDRAGKPTSKPTPSAAPTPARARPAPSRAAPTPASPSAAVPGSAPAAGPQPSPAAPAASPTQALPVPSCPNGYICFWTGSNYTGERGKLKDRNPDWTTFTHASCPNGTWSRCAASIYNNGDNCEAQLWNNVNYRNTKGTPGLIVARRTGVAQLASVPVEGATWDHQIRSNSWICP